MSTGLPAVIAAAAAASAACLVLRPPPTLLPNGHGVRTPLGHKDRPPLLTRFRVVLAGLVLLAGWTVLGGFLGLLAGGAAAGVTWTVLGRAEPPAVRRRREQLEHDLPTAVDLLATTLAAGGSVESAMAVVARAVAGPVGEELATVGHRLALGVDPPMVWREVAAHPQLGAFGRAALRAHESGASVAGAVRQLGEELRARERAAVEARAKSVEVKAAAPLGACFLPAFVLLGVVPMVVGVFSSIDLFG